MRTIRGSIIVLAAALAACGSQNTKQAAGESVATKPASPTGGSTSAMPGMAGMGGMAMQNDSLMPQMQAHMDTMMRAHADNMEAMLPAHRQMVANMLSQMTQQMRSMHMAPGAPWTALTDSIRADLLHMPEMSAGELKAMMSAHEARVMRLMAMHRTMMATTPGR